MHSCETQRLLLSEHLNVISRAATLPSATFMALDTMILDDYSVIFMRAWGAASPIDRWTKLRSLATHKF
jgi:hypothetical protein